MKTQGGNLLLQQQIKVYKLIIYLEVTELKILKYAKWDFYDCEQIIQIVLSVFSILKRCDFSKNDIENCLVIVL